MTKGEPEHSSETAYIHPDPVVDQALDWFVRRQGGDGLHHEQNTSFHRWLEADPAHRSAWEEVEAMWSAPVTLGSAKQLDRDLKPAAGIPQRRQYRWLARRPFAAGIVALAACLVLTLATPHLLGQMLPRMLADYTSRTGEIRQIALPDGSRMVLNTYSAVTLDFDEGRRGVRVLSGEAWFDVVHDASHPFRVASSHMEVEVKGTAFSVMVDDELNTVKLQRGAVDARHDDESAALVHLSPGQMVTASDEAMSAVSTFRTEESLAWLENRIVFDDTPLREALREMRRYYDGRIVVLNETLLDTHISGFYRTDRLADAIDTIVATAGGQTTHLPGSFIIIR